MKKLLKFLPLVLLAVFGMAFAGCGDNDDDIAPDQLPEKSRLFVQQYYPACHMVTITKDHDEYEVTLSDGTRIDFDKSGEWNDVDAPLGMTVATGFYPAAIDTYVSDNLGSASGINEISKVRQGYDVELIDGADLLFDYQGAYIGISND